VGSPTNASLEKGYPWNDLVSLSGREGCAWIATYNERGQGIANALDEALVHFRRGYLDEGKSLLDCAEVHRQMIRAEWPCIFHVLGRYYHGALAYYEYLTGDLAEAEEQMDMVSDAIGKAIGIHRFLLPLAPMAIDVPIQKARIARSRRDWRAMEQHLKTMYMMETGDRPLCLLSGGAAVDYSLLRRYFEGKDFPERYAAVVQRLLHLHTRLREFRRLTNKLYLIPNLVTISPPILR
jgi:hypothetical protein